MMSYSMLVDLTISLLEENKHLKADKEALIAGQETLQKYLAIIKANGISVEKYKDSINCLEKACDELKEALKKKDDELKAVKHYYNECLKDLKKAHADIERLQKAGEEAVSCFHRMESLYNIKRVELKVAKTEAIKEFWSRLQGIAYRSEVEWSHGEHPMLIELDDAEEIYEEMVGDTE